MKGNPQIIDALNKGLTIELTAINQYFVQSKMNKNWGFNTNKPGQPMGGLGWNLAMALGTMPFSLITAFLVLYYAQQHWEGAGVAVLAFTAGYIAIRLFLAHLPDTRGGRLVGLVSTAVQAAGLVIKDLSPLVSNFRAERSLPDYLGAEGTVAIAGIDTRKLTRILREKGAQGGCILVGDDVEQAKQLAENFDLMAKQQPQQPFRYKDKGSMAIIGRNKAVADLTFPKWHLKGFFAWMAWLFVHLFSLIRFNNKIKTLYNWTIAYITRNTSMRLIIGKTANNPELSASSSKDL